MYNVLFDKFKEVPFDIATHGHSLNLNIMFRKIEPIYPIKVETVMLGSPCHEARMLNNIDFIIGSFEDVFQDFDDFRDIVEEYSQNKSRLDLLVYNTSSCCLRMVKIFPK